MSYKLSKVCVVILDQEIIKNIGYDKFMIPDEHLTLYDISSEQARILNKGKEINVGWNYDKDSKLTKSILDFANKDLMGEVELDLDGYQKTWKYEIF